MWVPTTVIVWVAFLIDKFSLTIYLQKVIHVSKEIIPYILYFSLTVWIWLAWTETHFYSCELYLSWPPLNHRIMASSERSAINTLMLFINLIGVFFFKRMTTTKSIHREVDDLRFCREIDHKKCFESSSYSDDEKLFHKFETRWRKINGTSRQNKFPEDS